MADKIISYFRENIYEEGTEVNQTVKEIINNTKLMLNQRSDKNDDYEWKFINLKYKSNSDKKVILKTNILKGDAQIKHIRETPTLLFNPSECTHSFLFIIETFYKKFLESNPNNYSKLKHLNRDNKITLKDFVKTYNYKINDMTFMKNDDENMDNYILPINNVEIILNESISVLIKTITANKNKNDLENLYKFIEQNDMTAKLLLVFITYSIDNDSKTISNKIRFSAEININITDEKEITQYNRLFDKLNQ